MNASGIKDLHYIRKLSEIILKLLEPFAHCNLKEFDWSQPIMMKQFFSTI